MKRTTLSHTWLIFLFVALHLNIAAQTNEIRLIVRADDIGSSHSANQACIEAYQNGIVRSVELMVPCPWFEEAVKLLNENPNFDVGIHLTLTSEWSDYKWKPITCCPSITDKAGNFFPMVWPNKNFPKGTSIMEASWDINEIEKELRAQIELALKRVPHISHFSEHMGCLDFSEETKKLKEKLAKDYNLDIRLEDYNVRSIESWSGKEKNLIKMLENLKPGTYITVEHPAYNSKEMETIGHVGYKNVGQNRQEVLEAFTSEEVKQIIEERNIKLISYKDLISR